jgi:hypothetical protein
MVRSISAEGLAALAKRYGNEPINIVEVEWVPGQPILYADNDVEGIPGKIIEIGQIDDTINVSSNSSSQSLDVTLDDTDGSIKAIFDQHDIHKRTVRVWQYFRGLALGDKFLLFAGKISTPVVWSERDRTVKFTIISQLEDREVGFSAEEGQFPFLPADMVGKPWPMIFGTVLDSPALQVNQAVQGTTLTGFGILSGLYEHGMYPLFDTGGDFDAGLGVSLAQISAQITTLWCARACWHLVDEDRADECLEQINKLSEQAGKAVAQAMSQKMCAEWQRQRQIEEANEKGLGHNPIRILGGEDFPQDNPLVLECNGGLLWGHFHGQDFYVSRRQHPDDEKKVEQDMEDRQDSCPYEITGGVTDYDFRIDVPCGCLFADMWSTCECRTHGFIISTGQKSGNRRPDDAIIQQFWAEPGATVRIYSAEPITYIVSIIPGTVLAVKAYKQFTGERRLVDVPNNLYRVETRNYGTVTAVQLVFNRPLSSIQDQGWSDDVYVTFQSSVGPNIVDILKYLIENYTDLTWDDASFNYVRTKLVPFPANFPILDRKNTLDVLQEIAFQARCALWINNGVFHIKYLPEEPAEADTITVSDIDAESGIDVELTPTEDLVTKMRIKWRLSWAPGQTDRDRDQGQKWMILRHNVTKYGTQEEEHDFYIYNQPDTILKCATFWLIRKSNTWKRAKFKTFLNKLNLETFDGVNLNFTGRYVASGSVKAVIEKATYNSADNLIEFECLVPVRAGEMVKSPYYWPSTLAVDTTWPPKVDIDSNNAGGGGIGMGAAGQLPIGYIDGSASGGVVWVGGPNVAFRPRSDWGDRHPTDVGYSAQTVFNSSVYGELSHEPKPHLNTRLYLLREGDPLPVTPIKGGISIDIAKTKIVDSSSAQPDRTTTFKTIFQGITESEKLALRDDALLANEEVSEGAPLNTLVYLTPDSYVCLREDAWVASDEHQEGAQLTDALKIGESGYLCLVSDVYITEGDGEETKFDFKYDSEENVYGAGTAFLRD